MADDLDPPFGTPSLSCRHLIVCRVVWRDAVRLDDGFSLGKLVIQTRPAEGEAFPITIDRLFLFVQLTGPSGVYTLRARLVRIGETGYGEETEEAVVRQGGPVVFGPWDVQLYREEYFEPFAFPIENVRFESPGEYEFQLHADEVEDPIAKERLYVHR